ncbi:MAG TPA: hypothetical protein VFB02_14010 [Bradyrhizobium sp.]|nr:hypothetical protein [Bradyrhizobium sp.]
MDSGAVSAGCAIVQVATTIGVFLYLRGTREGKSETTDEGLADKVKRAEARIGSLEKDAGETHDRALITESEHRSHVRDCDRRYAGIDERLTHIRDCLDNMGGQINNLASGRTGKIYEVRPPRTRKPPS